MVVHLNGPGGASVRVTAKPPDESFRRLETVHPIPPLCLSMRALFTALIFRERRLTDAANRIDSPGGLSLAR